MKNKKLGQRRTNQREAILEVILEAGKPLTVAEIHNRASVDSKGLGIATVYRTVKLLKEKGRITVVTLPDGETRYEASNLGHHHHFQCLDCREVYDLELCPLSIPKETTLPAGFRLHSHEVTLYGSCPNCPSFDSED